MAFDLVLQGGRVVDPSQGIDAIMDVGFRDGRVARALADTATSPTGADAVYRTMIVRLGGHAKDVRTRDIVQQHVVRSIDAARSAHPGADPDEEMTNIVEFQTAHEASSRLASTGDSVLDTLVDMVGP